MTTNTGSQKKMRKQPQMIEKLGYAFPVALDTQNGNSKWADMIARNGRSGKIGSVCIP